MGVIIGRQSNKDPKYIIKKLENESLKDQIIIANRKKALDTYPQLKEIFDQLLKHQNIPKNQTYKGIIGGTYSGQWKGNSRSGVGEFMFHSQIPDEDIKEYYIGTWKDDKQNGFGAKFYKCNEYYIGNFNNGLPNGFGILTLEDGSAYEGQWVDGEQEGYGVEILKSDGWRFEGNFQKGKRQGKGRLLKEGMYELEGQFKDNDFVDGTVKYLNQSFPYKEYRGGMKDGKFDGNGKLDYKDGSFYDGQFQNHQKHGNSQFYYFEVQNGKWENDKLISV